MLRTVALMIGWIVLAFILIGVAMHLVGMFLSLAMIVGVLALCGLPIFLFFKFKNGSADPVDKRETRLYEPNGVIKLFAQEPSTTLLLTGDSNNVSATIDLKNDTIIQILKDDDKHAVKIVVKDGPFKGKKGWVSRGSVIGS